MKWIIVTVFVILGGIGWVRETCALGGGSGGSHSWACDTFTPNMESLQGVPPTEQSTSPYIFDLETTSVRAGHEIPVTLTVDREHYPDAELTAFIIQARSVSSLSPQGRWAIPDSSSVAAATRQCGEREADTATNRVFHFGQIVELTWVAPDNVPTGYRVQLVGAALDGKSQKYWSLHGNTSVWIQVTTATLIPESEGESSGQDEGQPGGEIEIEGQGQGSQEQGEEGVNPQGQGETDLEPADENDLLMETRMEMDALKKKEADIAQENLASETDSTLEDEKKQREEEYKWEMENFEKEKYEEELKRQARIDAELRDKEEWEARQWEEEKRLEEEEQRRREAHRARLGEAGRAGLEEVEVEGKESDNIKKTGAGSRASFTFVLFPLIALVISLATM